MLGILWQRWSFQRKFQGSCFTTGKHQKKVIGSPPKAGNGFDTCLKFENDQISFDFDNPARKKCRARLEVHNKR